MKAIWGAVRRTVPAMVLMAPSSVVTVLFPLALFLAALTIVAGGVGLVFLPLVLVVLRLWTDAHRMLAGRLLGRPVRRRFRPLRGGVLSWWRGVFGDRTTWRDLAWLPVQVAIGLPLGLLTVLSLGLVLASFAGTLFWWALPDSDPVQLLPGVTIADWGTAVLSGVPVLLVSGAALVFVLPSLARWWAALTLAVLDRSDAEQLEERVEVLTESRAGALAAHGAELRRIERDLHDGIQARLVSIALRLGIARQTMDTEPEVASTLLAEATEGVEAAMAELRTIVRGIHPPILSDRGLAGAVRSLVADCPVPAHLDLDETGALPAAVETAAYFTLAEALTNVAKHSGAKSVDVRLRTVGERLVVEVTDDGRGGIDEAGGSGVVGIRRRVAALDGVVAVDSPVGGPSRIVVELPCGR
ncbi:Signal transduction histidine kinase [Lentzea fradiae]|uniref:histidine kinase n=1 Tax=Lentzea fradiae TaxID=200378 RepID=A0A1G7XK44_9PSEU|nr:sensor histidine kinase [Lentzea fradiae]SDG84615.1 Signal transduction histidine kinase [Lentzea fradiae]